MSDIEVENDEGGLFDDMSVQGLDGIEDGDVAGVKSQSQRKLRRKGAQTKR